METLSRILDPVPWSTLIVCRNLIQSGLHTLNKTDYETCLPNSPEFAVEAKPPDKLTAITKEGTLAVNFVPETTSRGNKAVKIPPYFRVV